MRGLRGFNVEAALPHCCLLPEACVGFYLLMGTGSKARPGTEDPQGAWLCWALPAPLLCHSDLGVPKVTHSLWKTDHHLCFLLCATGELAGTGKQHL